MPLTAVANVTVSVQISPKSIFFTWVILAEQLE